MAVEQRGSIRVSHVSKWYESQRGPVHAAQDVDFTCKPGEFVSLIGPSGCGKSTVLSMIAGLMPPSAGEIRVDGEPLDPRRLNPNVGYMLQRDALLPWKTVAEHIALPLRYRKVAPAEAAERIAQWTKRVGLSGFEHAYPAQLSGGMRKRVSLATTLVYKPPILLMDEAFSGLDVQTRNLMENELLSIWSEQRCTVLFVTHDLEEAIALSDKIAVFTARPGTIKAVYDVPLPRPRDVAEIRFMEGFNDIYKQVWTDLRDEVAKAYAAGTASGAAS